MGEKKENSYLTGMKINGKLSGAAARTGDGKDVRIK